MPPGQPYIDPLPARTIADLAVDDEVTAPDFELGERFLDLSKEVSRLALLGIAGYGFLAKEIVMKGMTCHPYLDYLMHHYVLPLAAIITLGLSAATSLQTSQVSTHCMKLQIDIVRYIKRRVNPGWTNAERQHNDRYLEELRGLQRTSIQLGRFYLRAAVILLMVGVLATVSTFVVVLSHPDATCKEQPTVGTRQ